MIYPDVCAATVGASNQGAFIIAFSELFHNTPGAIGTPFITS
jgi:hypothetical protein